MAAELSFSSRHPTGHGYSGTGFRVNSNPGDNWHAHNNRRGTGHTPPGGNRIYADFPDINK